MKVGKELRRRRNELDMSLREVAELTELSSGFLSQLENDQVSPSLASLDRIARALRVPIYELLSADNRDPVVRAGNRPTQNLGSLLEVEILTNFSNWQMMPFYRKIDVGRKAKAVRIERAREEWIYILAGAMDVYLRDQDPHSLETGDAIHFASSRLEHVISVGDVPVEFICMMTPPAY